MNMNASINMHICRREWKFVFCPLEGERFVHQMFALQKKGFESIEMTEGAQTKMAKLTMLFGDFLLFEIVDIWNYLFGILLKMMFSFLAFCDMTNIFGGCVVKP